MSSYEVALKLLEFPDDLRMYKTISQNWLVPKYFQNLHKTSF